MSNLLEDGWIPIRRQSGLCEQIAPWQITEKDDPIVAIDAPRPDFNGALLQFLIGLLQTVLAPVDEGEWLDRLENPPAPASLKDDFAKYQPVFNLDAKTGSFMQDFDDLGEVSVNGIGDLLIDSPGGNAVKENKDHFVKRGGIDQLCTSCVVTALYTLQTNAPSGGQGHRTSLRGGGPLTTLVKPDENSGLPNDLWHSVWLNVLSKPGIERRVANRDKTALADIFPWMAATRTSETITGQETTPLDASPLQMYWGMPRRIKIDWQHKLDGGECHICNRQTDVLVTQYKTKNYGTNYTGAWQHPLSPYGLFKEELLPKHPQPGGFSYQHWLGWVDSTDTQFNALAVERYKRLSYEWQEQLLLHVFGYDMDNMKPRCWYETTYPLISVPDQIRLAFAGNVQILADASTEIAGYVRSCVKEAWFKRPGDAKGDVSYLAQNFYQHTQPLFFGAVNQLKTALVEGSEKGVLQNWHSILVNAALKQFDYWAANRGFVDGNPRRVVDARKKLLNLIHSKKIRAALMLPNQTKKSNKEKAA